MPLGQSLFNQDPAAMAGTPAPAPGLPATGQPLVAPRGPQGYIAQPPQGPIAATSNTLGAQPPRGASDAATYAADAGAAPSGVATRFTSTSTTRDARGWATRSARYD